MKSSLNSTGDINPTVDSSLNSNLDSSLNTASASDDSVMKLRESSTSEGENSIMEVVEQDEKKIEVPKKDFLKPSLPPHHFRHIDVLNPGGDCKTLQLMSSRSTGRQRDEVISLRPCSLFSDNSMELS